MLSALFEIICTFDGDNQQLTLIEGLAKNTLMKQYYIIRNDQQVGPYSLEELAMMSLTPDTMVWTEGLRDWLPAREVSELLSILEQPMQTPPSYNVSPPSYGQPSAPRYTTASPGNAPVMPPSYLVWSVLVTLFCCQLGGIISIIFSAQVSSRYARGDYEGAEESSRKARTWIIVSAIVGGVCIVAYLIWIASFAAARGFSDVWNAI